MMIREGSAALLSEEQGTMARLRFCENVNLNGNYICFEENDDNEGSVRKENFSYFGE